MIAAFMMHPPGECGPSMPGREEQTRGAAADPGVSASYSGRRREEQGPSTWPGGAGGGGGEPGRGEGRRGGCPSIPYEQQGS